MDPYIFALIVIVLVVGAGVYLNNKQHALYAAILAKVGIGGTTPAASPTSVTINHAPVTLTAGPATTPPPAVDVHGAVIHGCNGVPTPAGMTDTQFVQLVVAKQGVATLVNPKAGVLQAVITGSDGWFAQSLGPYFLRELIAQTVAGTPVGDRVRAFVASANPTIEVVTPAQDAAGNQAAGTVVIGAVTPDAPTATP